MSTSVLFHLLFIAQSKILVFLLYRPNFIHSSTFEKKAFIQEKVGHIFKLLFFLVFFLQLTGIFYMQASLHLSSIWEWQDWIWLAQQKFYVSFLFFWSWCTQTISSKAPPDGDSREALRAVIAFHSFLVITASGPWQVTYPPPYLHKLQLY